MAPRKSNSSRPMLYRFKNYFFYFSIIFLFFAAWSGIKSFHAYKQYHHEAYIIPLNKAKQLEQSIYQAFAQIMRLTQQPTNTPPQHNTLIKKFKQIPTNQSGWSIPQKEINNMDALLTFSAPQGSTSKQAIIPIASLTKLITDYSYNTINKVTLFDTRTNLVLASPSTEFVLNKTFTGLTNISQRTINKLKTTGRSSVIVSKASHKLYYVYLTKIPGTPFAVGISFLKTPTTPSLIKFIRQIKLTALLTILFVFTLCLYLYLHFEWPYYMRWLISIAYTMVVIGLIIFITQTAALRSYAELTAHSKPLLSQRIIDAIPVTDPPPIRIGLEAFSIVVASNGNPNSSAVDGTIWEKMPADADAKAETPNVFLINQESHTSFKKIAETKIGTHKIVKWWFSSRVKDQLYTRLFPFDYGDVSLFFVPKPTEANKTILPLLEDYTSLRPSDRPGIHKNIDIPNFYIDKSFFSSQKIHLDYNYDHATKITSFPRALVFHIVLRRYLPPLLLTYVLPCVIIYLMLFCYLMFIQRKKTDISNFRSDLIYFSALFITLAVTNNSYISSLVLKHFTFLSLFFVVGYVLVLTTTIIGAFYHYKANKKHIKQLEFIRLIYWPTLATFWLAFSYIWFF